jgi:hypothetical protein
MSSVVADVESDAELGHLPKKQTADCFLAFCRTVNAVTGCSAVLCLIAHAMAVIVGPSFAVSTSFVPPRPHKRLTAPLPPLRQDREWVNVQLLRVYAIVFAVLVVLVETEWQWFLSFFKVLENWIARGFLQSFLAVLTLQIAHPHGSSDMDKSIALYRLAAGYCMLSCAGFYALGGVLCFSSLREGRQRVQAADRRSHLEALLTD